MRDVVPPTAPTDGTSFPITVPNGPKGVTDRPDPDPTTVRPVDIEEFYDADERRRASAEIEFGRDWRDQSGVRYELNWVEDTGELYVLREPVPHEWLDPFGGIHAQGTHEVDSQEVEGMTVSVVGTVDSKAGIEEILDGWVQVVEKPDSVAWLVDRLRQRGVLGPADPSSPLAT